MPPTRHRRGWTALAFRTRPPRRAAPRGGRKVRPASQPPHIASYLRSINVFLSWAEAEGESVAGRAKAPKSTTELVCSSELGRIVQQPGPAGRDAIRRHLRLQARWPDRTLRWERRDDPAALRNLATLRWPVSVAQIGGVHSARGEKATSKAGAVKILRLRNEFNAACTVDSESGRRPSECRAYACHALHWAMFHLSAI